MKCGAQRHDGEQRGLECECTRALFPPQPHHPPHSSQRLECARFTRRHTVRIGYLVGQWSTPPHYRERTSARISPYHNLLRHQPSVQCGWEVCVVPLSTLWAVVRLGGRRADLGAQETGDKVVVDDLPWLVCVSSNSGAVVEDHNGAVLSSTLISLLFHFRLLVSRTSHPPSHLSVHIYHTSR
eukprot:scaffold1223_cov200-Alexandrium_tamarense.AAC.13